MGLITNADRDLRMSPAERAVAAVNDFNESLIQQQTDKARRRRRLKEHVPRVTPFEAGALDIRDADGQVTGKTMAVAPQHLVEQTVFNESVPRIVPTTWVPAPWWPFENFPQIDNVHAWEAIVDGYYCLRCLWRNREAHPAVCTKEASYGNGCQLDEARREQAFEVLLSGNILQYDAPRQNVPAGGAFNPTQHGFQPAASGLLVPN